MARGRCMHRTRRCRAARRAALVPILLYGGMIVFQVCLTQPPALRVVAFFAMGIPTLAALVAWSQWPGPADGTAA